MFEMVNGEKDKEEEGRRPTAKPDPEVEQTNRPDPEVEQTNQPVSTNVLQPQSTLAVVIVGAVTRAHLWYGALGMTLMLF